MAGKRILICVSEFPPVTGGVARHAHDLALHLGATHQVAVLSEGGQNKQSFPFPVHFSSRSSFYPFTLLNRFRKAWSVIRSFKPEVIIASNRPAIVMGALLLFCFPKIRFMAVVHGNELLDRSVFRSRVIRWALNRYEKVVAVSAYTQQLLIRAGFKGQSCIIHNGLADGWLKPMQPKVYQPGQLLVLATVGSIRPRKGHLHVVRTLPALKKVFPQVVYNICGAVAGQEYKARIIAEAETLGVLDQLRFVTCQNEQELRDLYAASTVYVLLSQTQPNGDTEGFGISLLEASACGTPVIGSRDCGIEDAVTDGTGGLLIDSDNTAQLVEAVQRITGQYSIFSGQALQQAQGFRWTNLVKQYEKLL